MVELVKIYLTKHLFCGIMCVDGKKERSIKQTEGEKMEKQNNQNTRKCFKCGRQVSARFYGDSPDCFECRDTEQTDAGPELLYKRFAT